MNGEIKCVEKFGDNYLCLFGHNSDLSGCQPHRCNARFANGERAFIAARKSSWRLLFLVLMLNIYLECVEYEIGHSTQCMGNACGLPFEW